MKITFNPTRLNRNPQQAFRDLSQKVVETIDRHQEIDNKSFYATFATLGERFETTGLKDNYNKSLLNFAELLISKGAQSMAGILYSHLIKLNPNNHKLREKIALNALAIAKRQHDPVHTIARAGDLAAIYRFTDREKYIHYLFVKKRALNDICTNYNKINARYKTISRGLKPKDKYQHILAELKIKIAEVLKNSDPKQAATELREAYLLAEQTHNNRLTTKVAQMLDICI